ncbi:hypothetical protein Y032_0364g3546 [Ancylostoma ceylanicum]|uniref:Uncharacterized protein n=1 Tax=Ancylostoma ceylanicum TaxID=53326 RepID=A0A016RW36_9BILA|nr:hypothetical protein Y032_0364g3546 [Ancylostoma ceylanicum]
MQVLDWETMIVKADGRRKHLRSGDDIALIASNISQAERTLDDFAAAPGAKDPVRAAHQLSLSPLPIHF